MRKSVLIAAAVVAATASAAVAAAAITAPAPVTALAAAQARVAYATAWTRSRCERVVLGAAAFGPRLCPAVSTGRGIAAVELAGNRVLWLGYAGGNLRDWLLETATPTSPRPRQLRFVEQDVELAAPIQLGPSDGALLVYAQGKTVVALRPSGARAFAWVAPSPVTVVAAADGRVAAGLASGEVDLVAGGAVRQRYQVGGAASAVAFSGDGIVVQVGNQLSRRTATLGPQPEYTLTLTRGGRLEDADATHAVYVAGGRAHLVTFPRAALPRDVALGAAEHAQLDGRRLVLSHGRTITTRTL